MPSDLAQPQQQTNTAAPQIEPEVDKKTGLQNAIISSNVPQVVMYLISLALDEGTSDIHIEPDERTVRIRYRVDGKLRLIMEYPPTIHSAVTARIKIMSNLKIDETRMPQDGRTQVSSKDGREMDLRVSTLPTVNGEKIVMRLQDKSRKIPSLSDLGIGDDNLAKIHKAIANPNGIVLTTGPTGSGKTTTLYSAMTVLNKPEVNIMTIEDPVEIQMSGLNQSQVKPDIGYSFAGGLRTALRQDPDIIMVGEIRDPETISVAVEAALTGHLVLSTIHTNSAAGTITRLLDMDTPAFLITATLNAVIAQRLVRRVCPHCKQEAHLTDDMKERITKAVETMNPEERPDISGGIHIYEGAGCAHCGGTGYKGRIGLFEIMEMNQALKELINHGASDHQIQDTAMKHGMRTLEQDGVLRILQGVTTTEEVYSVARSSE